MWWMVACGLDESDTPGLGTPSNLEDETLIEAWPGEEMFAVHDSVGAVLLGGAWPGWRVDTFEKNPTLPLSVTYEAQRGVVPLPDLTGDGRGEILGRSFDATWVYDGAAQGLVTAADALATLEEGVEAALPCVLDEDGAADLCTPAAGWSDLAAGGTPSVRWRSGSIDSGPTATPWASIAVADLDGDGLSEVFLGLSGAACAAPCRAHAAEVHVISGARSGDHTLPEAADATWTDPAAPQEDRPSLLAGDDFDGDGSPDLVVKVLGGQSDLWVLTNPLQGGHPGDAAATTILSHGMNWPLDALGDVDGDGHPDLGTYDDNGLDVFLSPLPAGVLDADAADLRVAVDGHPYRYGDLDGDGEGDLVVGSPYDEPAVFVYWGPLSWGTP